MQLVNTEQAEAWNGYEGTHWADHQDRYDAVNGGFNDYLLAAVEEGDRVLDVGCGTGQITRLAAQRGLHAFGIDLSAPMLRRAEDTSAGEGIANVTFVQGDAQVHPFPEAAFDVVVSRFGIMFFADPVAAFANIRRALRPGGRLAMLSMRDIADFDLAPVLASLTPYMSTPNHPDPNHAGQADRAGQIEDSICAEPPGRADHVDRAGKAGRFGHLHHTGDAERPEPVEHVEVSNRAELAARPGHANLPGHVGHVGQAECAERPEPVEHLEESGRPDSADRAGQVECSGRSEPLGPSGPSGPSGRSGGGEDGGGPLSLADPEVIRALMSAAGFVDVTCTPVDAVQVWGRDADDAAAFLADWGPVRFHLGQADPGAAHAALTDALRPFAGPDGVRLRGAGWLISAVRL